MPVRTLWMIPASLLPLGGVMPDNLPSPTPVGNTKTVGILGVIVGITSIIAPVIATHLHASPDIIAMIQQLSSYFNGGGLVAAYLGKPFTVQG